MFKKDIKIESKYFLLLVSFFISFVNNFHLFSFFKVQNYSLKFSISFFILITSFLYLFLNLFFNSKRKLFILFISIININTIVTFFTHKYNISIHPEVITTFIETDLKEIEGIFNFKAFSFYILVFTIIPWLIFIKLKIIYKKLSVRQELKEKLNLLLYTIILFLFIIILNLKNYRKLIYRHSSIFYSICPFNYIFSSSKLFINNFFLKDNKIYKIGDFKFSSFWNNSKKKTVFVIVIGESARSANFSLSGYERKTNPNLEKQNLVYFKDVKSCNTSTAASLPCMFSHLEKVDYLNSNLQYESMFKMLQRTGFELFWLENSSHNIYNLINKTKDNFIFIEKPVDKGIFRNYDFVMLEDMKKVIENSKKDKVIIVIHQYGSHGPDYYRRYPDEFKKFNPICESNDVSSCLKEHIVNAYDNTILATDKFISNAIDILKNNKNIDSFLFYASDHGESLGENEVFMHGTKYEDAPNFQKRVPMFFWFSDGFEKKFKIKRDCVLKKEQNYSHDNIFHTLYAFFKIEPKNLNNEVYKEELNIFNKCMAR